MALNKTMLKTTIENIKNGDARAFEKLYTNYNNYVYSIILDFFNHNILEAEDLMQEVFIKVFSHIDTVKNDEAFTGWIASVTLNVCKGYVRKKEYVKNKVVLVSMDEYEIKEDEKNLPYNVVEDQATKKIIQEAIDGLPGRQRLIMMLFYFEQYSVKRIAEEIDITESAVKVSLYKGRKSIKEELEKQLGIEAEEKNLNFGIAFMFTEYGKKLLENNSLSKKISDPVWRQLKPQAKPAVPSFIYQLAPILFAVVVILNVFAGINPPQNEALNMTIPTSTIDNTAYVNGKATNKVSLYFEEGSQVSPLLSIKDNFMGGTTKTTNQGITILNFLLMGVGSSINLNRFRQKNKLDKTKTVQREKRRDTMKTRLKKQFLARALAGVMMLSLVMTSMPVKAVEEPVNLGTEIQEKQVLEETKTPEALAPSTEATQPLNMEINGLASVDGIDFNVSIAKSLDGSRPADGVFANSDSIDLASVERYNMFYAYLKIDYANNSGADLTGTSITMQLPKQGDAGYYEVITQSGTPANWVAYPNTPTGDGNANFPAGNIATNSTTRLMTWGGTTITNGSIGTIYIKIPMRDPFTNLGNVEYKTVLNYSKSGESSTIDSETQFVIFGETDSPSFSLEKVDDLGFVPSEPDADQYFYIKYKVSSNYQYEYSLPKRDFEFDRFIQSARINLIIPIEAELMEAPIGTNIIGDKIEFSANNATIYNNYSVIIRYLKTDFTDSNESISISGVISGRLAGDMEPAKDIIGTNYTLTHSIGFGSTIPSPALGDISTMKPEYPLSEDALKVGSISFTAGPNTLTRKNDTINADELVFEYNGVEYVKNNSIITADYGITMIRFSSASWNGPLDRDNPMSGSIMVYFNDGTFEILKSFTEADLISSNILYGGNVPGVNGGYQPPAGKTAKRVVFTLKNPPVGFTISPFVNGYVSNYPEGGADSLRLLRTTNLYGKDTGLGRPTAAGSGDRSSLIPIVTDTNFQPQFTVERTSTGTVNPGQTDILKLQSFFSNKATQSFVNPEFDILLPAGYTFDSYTDQTVETNTVNSLVFNLPDGRLKDNLPVIEMIPNYNGNGRMLLRIKYKGILQAHETLAGLLTIRAAEYMSPGNYTIDGYFAAENIGTVNNLSNTYTPSKVDVDDMNGNGQINDYIFGTVSKALTISRGVGTSLYSQVQGIYDPSLTGQGTTKQNTIIDGALTVEYNGATPMNNVQLIGVLPHEDDGKTLYGGVDNGQRVTLAQSVDVSAYPGATVYYNNTPTDNPNDIGWSTTYTSDAQAVRVVLPAAYELISGSVEKVSIPLKLQVPGTTDTTQLSSVQGIGYLAIKLYSNTSAAGLNGASSTVESLALGINIQVFKDDNSNGIKDVTESWANNVTVDIFNLTDNPLVATPLYSKPTNASGIVSFIDSFSGVDFNLQGYRVVVHMPSGDYSYVTGVGNVTTDANGYQGVVFNTSNQIVNVVSAFSPKTMSISGNYWQDYEATPNGLKDAHDLVSNTAGRTVKLYNVTDGVDTGKTTTVAADGSYILENVVVGPEYRVEFEYNSAKEDPSILVLLGGNMVTEVATDILGYTFISSGMDQDDVKIVDAAMIENGTINVKFSVDGVTPIASTVAVTRGLPTTYTANIGTTQDTTGLTSGTFVVPAGYRLVPTEQTSKVATINNGAKTQDIFFTVELLEPNLSGTKTSLGSTTDLHPGDEITYTITVENTGTEEALDTVVTDQVPANTKFVSADQGGVVDADGQVSWTIDAIAEDGGSAAVSFTVKILPTEDQGTWNVVNDQAKFNGTAINNTSDSITQSVLTSVKTSDIGVGKFVKEGDTITYTITTENTGEEASDVVTIKDMIPKGTTYVDGSISAEGVVDGDELSISKDSLAPGESLILTFKVTVDKGAKKGDVVDNTGQVNDVDTNQVSIPVDEDAVVNGGKNIFSLPKTGEYMIIGGALLLGLIGSLLVITGRKRRKGEK